MRILLTNNSLSSYTGTETWTYAMAKELSKEHDVTILTLGVGVMADKVSEICPVVTRYSGEYDFAIVNHSTMLELLPSSLPKVFTSHSSIFDIEKAPDNVESVCINERVGSPVIRNGVDTGRFKPTNINKELKNILYLSNPVYSGGMKLVMEATDGYNLITIDEQCFEIERYIDKADLVISLGRGAIESMSAGKNVIYGDWRNDWASSFMSVGMVTKNTFNDFKEGWAFNNLIPFTAEDLRKEFDKYSYDRGEWLREKVLENFNIEKTAKQYLEYYGQISGKIPEASGK